MKDYTSPKCDWKEELREKWAWEKFFTPEVPNEIDAFIENLLEAERERTVDKILLKISDMEIEKAGNSAHTKHQIEVLIDNWYAKEREEYLNPSNSMELK